jgi:DNA polymerase-3 subunit gamma/tau
VLVARLVPGAPLDLPDAELAEVRAQAAGAEPAQLARLFDLAQRAVADVKFAEQPRFALEVALLKGVFLAPGADVADLLARVDALASGGPPPGSGSGSGGGGERRPSPRAPAAPTKPPAPTRAVTAPAPAPAVPPPAAQPPAAQALAPRPAAAPGPVRGDDPAAPLADRWRAAVEEIEQVSPAAAPALRQAALLWIRDGEIGLQLPQGLAAASAERRRAEIEGVLTRHFGRPTRLAVTLGEAPAADVAAAPSLAATEAAERHARSHRVREAAGEHPNVREAARILGGDIRKIEEL